jgi:hypothetical protein
MADASKDKDDSTARQGRDQIPADSRSGFPPDLGIGAIGDQKVTSYYSVPASGSNIVVRQTVGETEGQLTGVRIENLVVPVDPEEGVAYVKGIEQELTKKDRAAKLRLRAYRFLRFAMLSASAATLSWPCYMLQP